MAVQHERAPEIESSLKAIWGELLDVDPSTLCDQSRFFDFGGDSMLLLSLQALLSSRFNVELSTDALMRLETFDEMKSALFQRENMRAER